MILRKFVILFLVSDGRLPVSDGRWPINNGCLPVSDSRWLIKNGSVPVSDVSRLVKNGSVLVSHSRWPINNGRLPDSQPPIFISVKKISSEKLKILACIKKRKVIFNLYERKNWVLCFITQKIIKTFRVVIILIGKIRTRCAIISSNINLVENFKWRQLLMIESITNFFSTI